MINLKDALGPDIEEILISIKSKKGRAAENKPLLDFSHLRPENLEKENWIDLDSTVLQAHQVPYCNRCQNGWVITSKANSADDAHICQHCELPRRWINRLNRLNMPGDAVNMTFASYDYESDPHRYFIEELRRWIRGDHKQSHLYMYGTPGNGKSSALHCLGRESAYFGMRTRYARHQELFEKVQKTWKNPHAIDPFEGWLDDVKLLLIDEFGGIGGGASSRGDWYVEKSVKMIDEIYKRARGGEMSVVITSNRSPRQILAMLNDNVAAQSRLAYLFKDRVLQMRGRDRRVDHDHGEWSL